MAIRPAHCLLLCASAGIWLLLGACQQGPAGTESARTSPTVALSTGGTPNLCEAVPAARLAVLMGAEVAIDPESSRTGVCTYDVATRSASYSVVTRVEGSIETIDLAASIFPDGARLDVLGLEAYWATVADTLWFDTGGDLIAVQLTAFEGSPEEALELALSVARLLLDEL